MNTLAISAFNSLHVANRLKAAGVPEKQAEAEAEVLHEAWSAQAQAISDLGSQFKTLAADTKRDAEQNASKSDLREVRSELKSDIANVRGEVALLRKDMEKMELGLRKDMEAMENRLVTRLTKVMLTVTGIALGIVGGVTAIARLLSISNSL